MCKRMLVMVALLTLVVGQVSWGVLSDVLWSENFDGFNSGALPPQDATWSMDVGAGITSPRTDITGGSGNPSIDWPLTDTPGLIVGGIFPSSTAAVVATKAVSIPATENVVQFEYKMYANIWATGNYHGNSSYVAIRKSNGALIAYMSYRRYADKPSFALNDVAFTAPAEGFNRYAITLDFAAQTCSVAVDGVDQGLSVALYEATAPGEIGQINLKTSGYYSGGNDPFYQWVDSMSISQTPEPMTLSLLALGGIAALRRRR